MTDANGGSAAAGNPADGGAAAVGQDGGQGGAQAFDWKTTLGDQYPTYEPVLTAKGWKDPAALLGSYTGLEKLMGQDKITVPGKDAKPEDWEPVFNKLGRPEKPDGYQFQKPEGFDGYDDAFAGDFRGAAHKAGLNARQAAALHDWWVEKAQKGLGDHTAALEARKAEFAKTLDTEFGTKKDEVLALASKAAQQLGVAPDNPALGALETLGDMTAIKLLAKLGEMTKEGTLQGSETAIADAKSKIAQLEGDANKMAALLDPNHPQHEAVLKEKNALYQAAYG